MSLLSIEIIRKKFVIRNLLSENLRKWAIISTFWLIIGTVKISAIEDSRNFVIFINHDHSVEAWSPFNGRFKGFHPTRNLDAISKKGCLFTNAFCSNGSSGPGSATILTGKFAHSHGFLTNGQKFDSSQATIAKILTSKGYETAVFGRWDLMTEPAGFSHWEVLADAEEFYNPTFISPSGKKQIEGHATDIITDLLIHWIKGQEKSVNPFLAIVFYNSTRRPWMPTLRQLETYTDVLLPEPESLYSDQKDLAPGARYQQNEISNDLNLTNDLFMGAVQQKASSELVSSSIYEKNISNMNEEQFSSWQLLWRPQNEAYLREIPSGEELLRWKYQRFAKNYLRCIRDVDENIGRFKSFYQNFSDQNCVLIYSANQGRFLGENGWFGSQWMMEKSMRIPLLISSINGDDIPLKFIDQNVQDIDVAPTILKLSGSITNKNMDGIALCDKDWNSSEVQLREALYFHHYDFPNSSMIAKHYGMRTNAHKLIHYYQFGEWELFDLQKDSLESKNYIRTFERLEALKKKMALLETYVGDHAEKSIMPEKWRRIYRGPAARRE